MARPTTSFERYGRHINFVDIYADYEASGQISAKRDKMDIDGSVRQREGSLKSRKATPSAKDSFGKIPSYLLEYMPAHRNADVLETENHSQQGQQNAKQRMILDYCKPEYYRKKYNVHSLGRHSLGYSSNKSAKDHHRSHTTARAVSLKAAPIEPNYALDMGKKFLEVKKIQQRLAAKSKYSSSSREGQNRNPSKCGLEDRIQLIRNYVNDVAMKGVNHAEPLEGNPELSEVILHSPKRPETPSHSPGNNFNRSGRISTDPSPLKKKPCSRHTSFDDAQDVESKVSNCTENFLQEQSTTVVGDNFDDIAIDCTPHGMYRKKGREDYVEDKGLRNMQRQYDTPRGRVLRGKFIKYSELDRTRISATKVLMVTIKGLNYLSRLQQRSGLIKLEDAASKKLSFMLYLIKVQLRFRDKRNQRIMKERKEAINKIKRNCKHMLMGMIYDIRDKKVEVIKTFLEEYSVQGFKNVAIKFRHQVLKCQQWYKIFQSCSEARLICLKRLWDRLLHEIDGYDPAIMIPDKEREKILFKYLRKRRWEYRLTLIEYFLRVEGQHLLFTRVRKAHAKSFLLHQDTGRVIPNEEAQEHHRSRPHRISVDGKGKGALYIPQLLESKMDMKKPHLTVYTHVVGREWLKEQIYYRYNESKREYKRQVIEKLNLIKTEQRRQEKVEILRRPTSKNERQYVRKLLSAVDDHLFSSTAPPAVDDQEKVRKWSLVQLRRPTLSYLGQITLSNDQNLLKHTNSDD